jgi:hypothetical protein
VHTRLNEAAAQRKRFEALSQMIEQQREQERAQERQQALELIGAVHAMIDAEGAREWGHIRSPDDEVNLAKSDPEKFERYLAFKNNIVSWMQRAGRLRDFNRAEAQAQVAQQQTEFEEQFRSYARAQDELFVSRNKELADPQAQYEVRHKVVLPYLAEMGVSGELAAQLFLQDPRFRSAEMQQIVYDAARFSDAHKKALAAVPKAPPPPQRPGSATAGDEFRGNDAARLDAGARRGGMDEYVRLRRMGVGN